MDMIILDKGAPIDVLFIAEGTYPYVRGGVSTWIHQIITGMGELNFGVLFLGSREEDYEGIRYELPDNLVYLESFYLFSKREYPPPEHREGSHEVEKLKFFFREDEKLIPEELSDVKFYTEEVTFPDVLYGKRTWNMIEELYIEADIDIPFIDYFWTLRNIFLPLWVLVRAVKSLEGRDIRLIHSPSTGYAGFLGALLNRSFGIPYIITEHGIYTRERKIDILNSRWIKSVSSTSIDKYDIDDLKKLWINFFVNVGKVCYWRANEVFSLFDGARQVQINFGCPPEKTRVIPNGVEIERYAPIRSLRAEEPRPVVALIGRVTPIKDIKTFIKAMKLLIEQLPEAEGWIVGPEDEDPDYAKECRMMVKALRIEDKVKFFGFRRMEEVLKEVSLTTLTSISEGMPMVVLESFAAGVPCVTTDVGSCRQLVYGGLNDEDALIGKAGEVVPVGHPNKLAEAYRTLLEDKELWKSCSLSAIERVERFYSYDRFLKSYREVYTQYMEAKVGGNIY
ncbi:GT4 family glycosyltransferase PelF [Hydrogenivirga sp.]